jgi:hypothetical protein
VDLDLDLDLDLDGPGPWRPRPLAQWRLGWRARTMMTSLVYARWRRAISGVRSGGSGAGAGPGRRDCSRLERVEVKEALAAVHASEMRELRERLDAVRRAKTRPSPLLTASRTA